MSAQPNHDAPYFGALLMLGFIVFGPFIDLFAKLASETMPIGQIATARLIVQGAILLPIAYVLGRLTIPRKSELWLYLARGFLILASTAFITAALRFMPIADALAIFFVAPLFLTLLSALILKETVGWRRILACCCGFLGALLVIQPSFEAFGPVAFFPLGTAVCFTLYLLLTRTMAQRIDPITMQAYTSVGALVAAFALLPILAPIGIRDFALQMPVGIEWTWLVLTGVAAAVAHLFLTYAFRYAPASLLGPMHYLEIVSASIIGYIVFGDLFNGTAAVGVAIIIAAGLYLIFRERQLSRQAPQSPHQDNR